MPKYLSASAAVVGVTLAVIVTASGFRTSTAQFAASTENRASLWEAADMTMAIGEDRSGTADLFLDSSGMHPASRIQNCVLIDVDTTTSDLRVRFHGEILGDGGLARFFEVEIEQGTVDGGCERFVTEAELYDGTLLGLATTHGSFDRGVPLKELPAKPTPFRFTGSVMDTNDAQGLATEYVVHLEAKP